LTSRDPREGAAAFAILKTKPLARTELPTAPLPAFACSLDGLANEPVPIPKLLGAYLSIGATICGPPAIDREFGTIDLLTMLDFEAVLARARNHF